MEIGADGTRSERLYLPRRTSNAGRAMDSTVARPIDIYDPSAVDTESTAKLDKFQLAARDLLSDKSHNRIITAILAASPVLTDDQNTKLLSIPQFVYTDYTFDIEGMF